MAQIGVNCFLVENSYTGQNFPIETLMKEIRPVFTENEKLKVTECRCFQNFYELSDYENLDPIPKIFISESKFPPEV